LIGHTKEHVDDGEFRKLLKTISSDADLKVVSFSDISNQLRGKLSVCAVRNSGPKIMAAQTA
jgi:hypothetical protein